MLSFKSYLPDDKDFGYSNHDEDPCTSLFEQYLNQDPVSLGDSADDSHGFQAFDFAFDAETESSESCSADSKLSSSQPAQHQPLAILNSAPIQEPLPLRVRPKLLSGDAPGRSISSSELLNLEGRANHHAHSTKTPVSSTLSPAAPTLRRKAKFCTPVTETLRGRSHRVTKTPSAEMIRPGYHQDNSSYNEWTQRFEQISIQAPTANLESSPPRNAGTYRDKRPSRITTSFDPRVRQQQGCNNPNSSQGSAPQNSHLHHAATAPLPQEWQNHGLPGPSPMTSTDYNYINKPQLERSQTQQHLRHPSSWDYGPVSPLTPDFISPNHVQPHWLHSLNSNTHSYHENGTTLQSTPAIQNNPVQDFTSQDLGGFQYEQYVQFVNEDPSNEYSVLSPDRFFTPIAEFLATPLPPDSSRATPHTPPPRSTSPSPPLHTPSKPHTRSKSTHHRRQKSLSTLKSPRSATTLKHPKSAHSLKSPSKSTSTSTSGTFGFVNFTEADKGKILTGVAPSGSSKTKARREMEAVEKKRKMSLAAVRAVEEAGGDVEVLRREGVFDE